MAQNLAEYHVRSPGEYRLCKRCFMTGKSCIYERNIVQKLTEASRAKGKAFMLMPFGSTMDEVYRTQIEPCLHAAVGEVCRADDVSRTGYVICEKICRQIQESQLVCAEVSCDNSNVFYELGLAYALQRDIILLYQASIGASRESLKSRLNMSEGVSPYKPFQLLLPSAVRLWQPSKNRKQVSGTNLITILLADTRGFVETVHGQKLNYSVDGLCRGAIHKALNDLFAGVASPWKGLHRRTITLSGQGYVEDDNTITFDDIEDTIRRSSCVLICMSRAEPASYFWLGFAHGLEKDVIPITALAPKDDESTVELAGTDGRQLGVHLSDLPFDMRALWHIFFYTDRPKELEYQIGSILEIISTRDIDKVQRLKFWEPFLDAGRVFISVGSVELTENYRHVVGEWDYRTVSELTSFLASTKETMETIIQTPTFQASSKLTGDQGIDRDKYIEELRTQLASGNSIILASADVNDMTEVALATFAGVSPFAKDAWKHPQFNGVVGFKGRELVAFETPSVYFQILDGEPYQQTRGFFDVLGGDTRDERTYKSPNIKYSQSSPKGYSYYFGHVARLRPPKSARWVMVIQGITGPATLGIAQALTGGIHEQFTIFDERVPEAKRLAILKTVAEDSGTLRQLLEQGRQVDIASLRSHSEEICHQLTEVNKDSIECIVKVYVMDGADVHHDERRIVWWDIAMGPREMSIPKP